MEMDSSTSIMHTMIASPIWREMSGMGNHHETVSLGSPCAAQAQKRSQHCAS